MVNHFASETAAREHLIRKGFKYDAALMLWIVPGIQARLMNSVRGWHIFFYEA